MVSSCESHAHFSWVHFTMSHQTFPPPVYLKHFFEARTYLNCAICCQLMIVIITYAIPLFFFYFFQELLELEIPDQTRNYTNSFVINLWVLEPQNTLLQGIPRPIFKYLMPLLIGGTHPFVGDGFCNAETNNAVCNFDGGDCCGTCVNKKHCSNHSRQNLKVKNSYVDTN